MTEHAPQGEGSAAIPVGFMSNETVADLLRQAQDDHQSIDNLGREVSRLREALQEIRAEVAAPPLDDLDKWILAAIDGVLPGADL